MEASNGFSYNDDMNSGSPLGLGKPNGAVRKKPHWRSSLCCPGWLQSTIDNGVRSSAATAYLPENVQNRSNLYILLSTRATRILPSTPLSESETPDLRTVEFAQDDPDMEYGIQNTYIVLAELTDD